MTQKDFSNAPMSQMAGTERAVIVSLPFPSCGLRAHGWGRSLFGSVGSHITWKQLSLMGNWLAELPPCSAWFTYIPASPVLLPFCPQSPGCNQCGVSVWLPGYFSHHNCSCHVCTNTVSCKGKGAGIVVCPQPWNQKEMLGLSNLAPSVTSQLSLRNMRFDQNVF